MSGPTRRRASRTPAPGETLSDVDLAAISAGLEAGRRVTVYLRDAIPSLGLDAGASARVVTVDGTTVTVRPKGVDDELPYEADELRLGKEAPPAPAKRVAPRSKAAPRPSAPAPSAPAPAATSTPAASSTAAAPSTPVPPKTPRRPKAQPAAVTVTIGSGRDDLWTVQVSHGAKKLAGPAEVTADKVLRAVRELGDATASAAVEDKIEAARSAALERVEALSRELDEARRALDRLKNE